MNLTIVTSCTGYGQYLAEWAASIAAQTVKPACVCLFTHGTESDRVAATRAVTRLTMAGIPVMAHHVTERVDFGTARNKAVAMSRTEWVMHLDADDTLMPHAIEEFRTLAPEADVISAGYVLAGRRISGVTTQRQRLYRSADGVGAFALPSMAAGVSPFRRSFWEREPYRTDMVGAWDTALWIGFAKLGARFRATSRAVFQYRQHDDSIFNQRRRIYGWNRALTGAQLKALRRGYTGVAIVVPRDLTPSPDRERVWQRVRAHYETHHPEWPIVEGVCPSPRWSKGTAIAHAATDADILVIADADCLVDPLALRQSVESVRSGAGWAMPHTMVYRAHAAMTEAYCATPAELLLTPPDHGTRDREPYEGAPGGGIVVIRHVMYQAIGGMPFAFHGWGSEDRALACLANTLLGPCVRGDADLIHLWHAPQSKRHEPHANLQLLRKLGAAALISKDALIQAVRTMSAEPAHYTAIAPQPKRVNTSPPVQAKRAAIPPSTPRSPRVSPPGSPLQRRSRP